jgi:single-stranded DNA-specific DHH superfamily exonuclease
MNYDVFNGDADGICALLQLRKEDPREATLVTGVKRDIALLARISAGPGDCITVLDVSLDKNRAALAAVLARGGRVLYVDHHFPGEIPEHPGLTTLIDESPDVCTAALVNDYLQGRQLAWAVTGAFGDNLGDTARRLAAPLALCAADLDALEQLGTCINYNGYGPALADLHFDPAELYRRLYAADGPLEFVRDSADFDRLSDGYRQDMAAAAELQPLRHSDAIAVYLLPDEPWARRVSGVFSNDLATDHPRRAHAVLTEKSSGNYLVSVRAPLADKRGAAELCMQFPTGGGRAAAAGINDLPRDSLETFIERFVQAYSP